MPTTAQAIAWAEEYRQAWENAEFWTRMLAGAAPLTLPGCLLMRFDEDGLCIDLREYWQTLPELRDPWPGWGD